VAGPLGSRSTSIETLRSRTAACGRRQAIVAVASAVAGLDVRSINREAAPAAAAAAARYIH